MFFESALSKKLFIFEVIHEKICSRTRKTVIVTLASDDRKRFHNSVW